MKKATLISLQNVLIFFVIQYWPYTQRSIKVLYLTWAWNIEWFFSDHILFCLSVCLSLNCFTFSPSPQDRFYAITWNLKNYLVRKPDIFSLCRFNFLLRNFRKTFYWRKILMKNYIFFFIWMYSGHLEDCLWLSIIRGNTYTFAI